MVND
ncbi:hypothetical protein SS209_00076 [Salmonella enterica subsp. enterica serovar Senftenberg str. SS209]|jgi:hypothetical protein